MSFNIVDIQVVTDYTDFSNTVRFQLNVPVTSDDAATIFKALSSESWDTVSGDITTAVKNAPQPIQDLVAKLTEAYSGKSSSGGSGSGGGSDQGGGSGSGSGNGQGGD